MDGWSTWMATPWNMESDNMDRRPTSTEHGTSTPGNRRNTWNIDNTWSRWLTGTVTDNRVMRRMDIVNRNWSRRSTPSYLEPGSFGVVGTPESNIWFDGRHGSNHVRCSTVNNWSMLLTDGSDVVDGRQCCCRVGWFNMVDGVSMSTDG